MTGGFIENLSVRAIQEPFSYDSANIFASRIREYISIQESYPSLASERRAAVPYDPNSGGQASRMIEALLPALEGLIHEIVGTYIIYPNLRRVVNRCIKSIKH